MRIRVKFAKYGAMKFVGHLDTMRYFQKAVRRAGLPAAFSEGYSPHMLMSFAAPLGVGMTSDAEYFDLELGEEMPTKQAADRLDQQMTEGFRVREAKAVEGGKANNAMSLVAAADYLVWFRRGKEPLSQWPERFEEFLSLPNIWISKEGKSGVRQVDIKPYIYKAEHLDQEQALRKTLPEAKEEWEDEGTSRFLYMRLASASANYTRPDQVIGAFYRFLELEEPFWPVRIHRLEVFADKGNEAASSFVPLGDLGKAVF